jgi:hypothetical protein
LLQGYHTQGKLRYIIKTSLAFSSTTDECDYLRRLYNTLVRNLDKTDLTELRDEGFTIREIEKLKVKKH